MLLNKGRHPYTNETIIPEEVVEHGAYSRSVMHGKPQFPVLVSTHTRVTCHFLMSLNRAPKYMVLANGGIRAKATISLSMGTIGIHDLRSQLVSPLVINGIFPQLIFVFVFT